MPRIRATPTLHRSFEVETLMRVFAFASVIWLAVFGHLIPAQSRTFGGYVCSHDCELHSAGYKWARDRSIDDTHACPLWHIPVVSPGMRFVCSGSGSRSGRRRSGKFSGCCCRAGQQMINPD
jgi:hypothetical protein